MSKRLTISIITILYAIIDPLWAALDWCISRLPLRRFERRHGNRLETAVVTLTDPAGRELILVGMRHLGAIEYFQQIATLINDRPDHLLLSEGIRNRKGETVSLPEKYATLFDMARSIARITKLAYQSDCIKYAASRTPRLTDTTRRKLWANIQKYGLEKRFAPPEQVISFLASETIPDQFKRRVVTDFLVRLASVNFLARMFRLFRADMRLHNQIINHHRSQIAARSIRRAMRLEQRNVISLWGNNHLPRIIDHLRTAGYQVVKTEWLTVMTIRKEHS